MAKGNRRKKVALRAKKARKAQHQANRELKLKSSALTPELMEAFSNYVPDCFECGSERIRFEAQQLPPEKLAFWQAKPEFDTYRYFVHCPKCGTYNPMGEMGHS